MDRVTIVMPYYENGGMLLHHLAAWREYPQRDIARVSFIVVDDGSPAKPALSIVEGVQDGAMLLAEVLRNLRIFRIKPDIPWNQDGARNLAMKHAETEWAFMTDMDHLVRHDQIARMLALDPAPRHMYMPKRYRTDGTAEHPHPNSFLLRVSDFWSMGGYDEDFAGWYGSDGNFRRCAKAAGLIEKATSAFHTTVYRSSDCKDARTTRYGRKGSAYHVPANQTLFRKARGPAYKAVNPIRFEWERVF